MEQFELVEKTRRRGKNAQKELYLVLGGDKTAVVAGKWYQLPQSYKFKLSFRLGKGTKPNVSLINKNLVLSGWGYDDYRCHGSLLVRGPNDYEKEVEIWMGPQADLKYMITLGGDDIHREVIRRLDDPAVQKSVKFWLIKRICDSANIDSKKVIRDLLDSRFKFHSRPSLDELLSKYSLEKS